MRTHETPVKHQIANHLESGVNHQPVYEAGQLRRAKMHAARLIEVQDDKQIVTPHLHRLLEASIILETTDFKILGSLLKRKPAAIRTDFMKICTFTAKYRKYLSNCHPDS
jgi:hypothetical protein